MSNLSRSAMVVKAKPMSWVVRMLYGMFNGKLIADIEDEAMLRTIQPFHEFVIEYMLQNAERRQDAELNLYLLLQSVKEHMSKKHPMLHSFARFLGLIDEEIQNSCPETVQKGRSSTTASQKRDALMPNSKTGTLKISNAFLPPNLLAVYLFARESLLHSYSGEYSNTITMAKSNSVKLRSYIRKVEGKDDDGSSKDLCEITLPDHVIVNEQCQLFIPLDRAIHVTKVILSFLSESKLNIAFRHIEAGSLFLTSSGTFEHADGNHSMIRASFRRQNTLTNTTSEVLEKEIKSSTSKKLSVDAVTSDQQSASNAPAIVVGLERALEA
jgi:hypothetical protein